MIRNEDSSSAVQINRTNYFIKRKRNAVPIWNIKFIYFYWTTQPLWLVIFCVGTDSVYRIHTHSVLCVVHTKASVAENGRETI